jgi:hypothetical protein
MYEYIDTYSIKIYAIAHIYTIRRSIINELSQELCASNFRRLNFTKEQLCIYILVYVCVYMCYTSVSGSQKHKIRGLIHYFTESILHNK